MKARLVIKDKLRILMESSPTLKTLRQLEAKSGVGYGTLQRLRNGEGNPTQLNIQKIAAAFGLTVDEFYSIGSKPKRVETGIAIPHLTAVASMGEGIDLAADDTVIDRIVVKSDWVRETLPGVQIGNLAVISGRGDSMAPTYSDGDLLLVDTSKRRVDIDGVYVLAAHQRLFIKRVRQKLDGSFEISSDNPTVKTVDTLNGGHEVDVLGRVVWCWNGKRL